MEKFPSVILKPGKEAAVLRRHPWIFSGALDRSDKGISEGDIVEVYSSAGKYLATGHFANGSIAIKVFSFLQTAAGHDFWLSRLQQAMEVRRKVGLTESSMTSAYRLVFSEGDEMPGLIIDWYNGVAVIQAHSAGMHKSVHAITEALRELYGEKLSAVYDKSAETLRTLTKPEARDQGRSPKPEARSQKPEGEIRKENTGRRDGGSGNGFLFGTSGPVEIAETGHKFVVDFVSGQKTGFFLDQRSNRMFAQFYAKNKKVLNTFCYSGAFSVYCLKGGAMNVHSVDSSAQAIELTRNHMKLNGLDTGRHTEDVCDVKVFLKNTDEKYSMIILDPPAFAKTHQVTNNALHAYTQLNASAIRHLEPGGLLFTFSCSQAISREMFRSALQSAAIETGRNLKLIHHLSQGPDHPVSICHPEGEYLKGMILVVE